MIRLTMWLYALFFIGMKLLLERTKHHENKNKIMFYLYSFVLVFYAPIFIILDVLFDITVGSVYFLRLPEWGKRDKTFTARLKLMQRTESPTGWRYKLAIKFCRLLDHADPGHC